MGAGLLLFVTRVTLWVMLPDNISAKIMETPDGCWLWTAAQDSKGYGGIRFAGRMLGAHRVVYQLLVGDIPEGLDLDHLCRVPSCVNPGHLEPVTRKENVRRGLGNKHVNKTHCKSGHPFAGDNLFVRSDGYRGCMQCQREKTRKFRVTRSTGSGEVSPE